MGDESVDSRLARVETHVEHILKGLDQVNGKVDVLLAKPSTGAQIVSFLVSNWKIILIVVTTLIGGSAAASPIAELLK